MGTKDGSIIDTIITIHMPRNIAVAPSQVCPHIGIHAVDIVQPPDMGISPMADMDEHQAIVPAALAAKSNAETPKKTCWEVRLEDMVPEIGSRDRSRGPLPRLRNARWADFLEKQAEASRQFWFRSALFVLVMSAVPQPAGLVAAAWRAVEPLVHAPEPIQPASVGRVGVVDDAVFEREGA